MKKNRTQTTKEKALGKVRVPIPRPGGPMKDKKKYNRKRTLSDEQRKTQEQTSCAGLSCLECTEKMWKEIHERSRKEGEDK